MFMTQNLQTIDQPDCWGPGTSWPCPPLASTESPWSCRPYRQSSELGKCGSKSRSTQTWLSRSGFEMRQKLRIWPLLLAEEGHHDHPGPDQTIAENLLHSDVHHRHNWEVCDINDNCIGWPRRTILFNDVVLDSGQIFTHPLPKNPKSHFRLPCSVLLSPSKILFDFSM